MRSGAAPLDSIGAFPLNDAAKTYALIKAGRTTAVFQLESRGMKDLIRRLQPDHFEDIVALVALFRPGPLQSGMVEDFIERKHSPAGAPIDYLLPALKGQCSRRPTAMILYQEQVMQIACRCSPGYTLGGAGSPAACDPGKKNVAGNGAAALGLLSKPWRGQRAASNRSRAACHITSTSWRSSRVTASTSRTRPPTHSSTLSGDTRSPRRRTPHGSLHGRPF